MEYKLQFKEDATEMDKYKAELAASELIRRFQPLFRKYVNLIQSGRIDYTDSEMKRFVSTFIQETPLKAVLHKQSAQRFSIPINRKFEFVVETYGKQPEDILLVDMEMCFLILAKRYKQVGRNFCAYLYNCYGFEVSRHIKKYIKNPANIPYRNVEYEDFMNTSVDAIIENCFEDKIYENSQGIPDYSWIGGESCSDMFQDLTVEERKLLIKYYMEDYNDRQIAELYGMHINTTNQKRRGAVFKLAEKNGIDFSRIKRSRKSGKKALFGTQPKIPRRKPTK